MRTIVVGLFGILIAILLLLGLVMLPGSGASSGLTYIFSAILLAMIVDTWRVSQETRDEVRQVAELLRLMDAALSGSRTKPAPPPAQAVKQATPRTAKVRPEPVSDSRPDDWGPVQPRLR